MLTATCRQDEDVSVNLNYVLHAIDNMRRPLGTDKAPGRSCEHIRQHSIRPLENGQSSIRVYAQC